MADPTEINPTDPELLDAIKRPLPTVTEDPAKIQALLDQAAAINRAAAAQEQLVAAFAAEVGMTPPQDWAIWQAYALARSQVTVTQTNATVALWADGMLEEFKSRFPAA